MSKRATIPVNPPPRSRTLSRRAVPGLLPGLGLVLILAACGGYSTPVIPTPTLFPAATLATAVPDFTPTPTVPGESPEASPYRSGFPDPAGYVWQTVVVGLNRPVDVQNAGDGSQRLFVVEKGGRIQVIRSWQALPEPFLDISGRVGSGGSEQGLLGLAFHPGYASNGVFFVNYTDRSGNTVVARFQASPDDPDRALPASEQVLLRVDQPYANHNGGGLAFGPDGRLYIGLGDGGSGGDPQGNGQNPSTYLGKMLRLDVDDPAAAPEVWASGLRNPWRYSFDPLTGDLYVADVGQGQWEEVNFVPAGAPAGLNFGWSYYEGSQPFSGQPPAGLDFVWPVAEYPHSGSLEGMSGCSVTGGYVYRGQEMPEWQGVYFFGDYCSGGVFGLARTGESDWLAAALFSPGGNITTFGVDEAGELYLAEYGSGSLLRLMRR